MTEVERWASGDPLAMLEVLRGRVSDRKLRLFACACCRIVWDSLTAERVRRAVETAERYADGEVAENDLDRAHSRACTACANHSERVLGRGLVNRASIPAEVRRMGFAANTCHVHKPFLIGRLAWIGRDEVLRIISPSLLRDIVGHPLLPVTLDPAWQTDTVVALARGIYDDRAFDRLPVLADALDDAGCDAADLLAHCRDRALTHVRGCWAVDLLLDHTLREPAWTAAPSWLPPLHRRAYAPRSPRRSRPASRSRA